MFVRKLLISALLLISCAFVLQAQQKTTPTAPPTAAPSPEKSPNPCNTQNATQTSSAPKPAKSRMSVFPVVQRLNGFEVLALMRSRGADIKAVDSNFLFNLELHTNVVAGFTIGDGKTLITRLPQAEMTYTYTVTYNDPLNSKKEPVPPKGVKKNTPEIVESTPAAPGTIPQPKVVPLPSKNPPAKGINAPFQQQSFPTPFMMSPKINPESITVFAESGCQLNAKFIGLDGFTGLSLLQVEGFNQTPLPEADVKKLAVAQNVRLYAPMPLGQQSSLNKTNSLSLKVTTLEGKLKAFEKNRAGEIRRITVVAQNMTPELVGGVVLNSEGEAIGMIEGVTQTEARVIPITDIKQAIDRVRTQAERKPQPWLGVRGESVNLSSFYQLTELGWSQLRAAELLNKSRGLLLTSVPQGTPAALSQLKVGDVVLSVNQKEIKNAEDFTSALSALGENKEASFGLLRPSTNVTETVKVKIGETTNPIIAMGLAESYVRGLRSNDLLLAFGMLTVRYKQNSQPNKPSEQDGRVVLSVYPESIAEKTGLKTGDIVETVNGQNINLIRSVKEIKGEITMTVIRNKETLVFKFNPIEQLR